MVLSSGYENSSLYFDFSQTNAKLTPSEKQQINYKPISSNKNKAETTGKEKDTAGPGWFNMKAGEMTQEAQRDLKVIQMRNALDKKHFYKKTEPVSKFFQIGEIMDSPTDFYSSRIPRKARKETVFETLLEDTEKLKYLKKKFLEVQEKKQSGGKKWYKKNHQSNQWKKSK